MRIYGFWFYPYWYCPVLSVAIMLVRLVHNSPCLQLQSLQPVPNKNNMNSHFLRYDLMISHVRNQTDIIRNHQIIWQSNDTNQTSFNRTLSSCQILRLDCKWLHFCGLDDLRCLSLITVNLAAKISCQPRIWGNLANSRPLVMNPSKIPYCHCHIVQ
jgi:hypothetical protein